MVCFTHSDNRKRLLQVVAWVLAFSSQALTQERHETRKAPSIDGGVEWVNTEQPITLAALRGKFVILDFWTYCCINCLQTLPDLKKLEHTYPNELVVIGVHAPKFFGERDSDNIRAAILRHEVEHPVVNDANVVIAKRYGVNGWPSLRVIDPEGNLIASHYGEATFEMLDAFMKKAIPRARRKGTLDERPTSFKSTLSVAPEPLRFPGKVLPDLESERLYIADSGHHRILVTSLAGTAIDVIGTGERGRGDGGFEQASFAAPQGLALKDDLLYVADTENHLIRKVNLKTRRVSTLAGTGRQGATVVLRKSDRPRRVKLASPWDVAIHGETLFIAMAGMHQIWRMTLDGKHIQTFSGSGREDIVDGRIRPAKVFEEGVAAYAQPTGLALGDSVLYVADSEGSSIRAISLRRGGTAQTLLGTAALPKQHRLFTFGDRNGPLNQALLQHPMCVAYWKDRLFVADTYNNQIKVIDLKTSEIATLAGGAVAGHSDEPSRFDEPTGVSVGGDILFVADTNNHAIRMIDIPKGGPVQTLSITGLSAEPAHGEGER